MLPTGGEPFRRAGTFQGFSVNVEFVMSEHSVQGISNFRHRLHSDKVSDKASDKERKINPTPPIRKCPNSSAELSRLRVGGAFQLRKGRPLAADLGGALTMRPRGAKPLHQAFIKPQLVVSVTPVRDMVVMKGAGA